MGLRSSARGRIMAGSVPMSLAESSALLLIPPIKSTLVMQRRCGLGGLESLRGCLSSDTGETVTVDA